MVELSQKHLVIIWGVKVLPCHYGFLYLDRKWSMCSSLDTITLPKILRNRLSGFSLPYATRLHRTTSFICLWFQESNSVQALRTYISYILTAVYQFYQLFHLLGRSSSSSSSSFRSMLRQGVKLNVSNIRWEYGQQLIICFSVSISFHQKMKCPLC